MIVNVTEKSTGIVYGLYEILVESEENVLGMNVLDTSFLIFKEDKWQWVKADDFRPSTYADLFPPGATTP